MSLQECNSLVELTESEIRRLTREDVTGLSGYLASTITADQIRWFDPAVLGQFLLGECKSGLYNFSGGNYLKPQVIGAITLEQIEGMLASKDLPSVRDLERYLMVRKLTNPYNSLL